MPVNEWVEVINVSQYLSEPMSDCNEAGYAKFLVIRDKVVAELQKLKAWMPLEDIRRMDRDDPRRGEALVISYLVKDVAEADTVSDFHRRMDDVRLWANEKRVWLSG